MRARKKYLTWERILALLLVLMLTLSISTTVFAANDDRIDTEEKGSITVEGLVSGVKISVYRIINVNINENGQPENPMYTWNENIRNWVKTKYSQYIDNNNFVEETYKNLNAEKSKEFLETLAGYIKSENIEETKEETAQGTSVTFQNMDMGQYLLIATPENTGNISTTVYQPATVSLIPSYSETEKKWTLDNQNVNIKKEETSITKEVLDPNDQTVAVGDDVTYQLEVKVPIYPAGATAVKFIVGDHLSKGLTYQTGSVKIKNGDMTLIEGNAYTVSEQESVEKNLPYTFLITFTEDYVKKYGGVTLTITYRAVVNNNAFEKDALNNKAFIGFNRDPFDNTSYTEIPKEKNVYTYGIQVKKVDKEGKGLSGAEFTLTKEGEQTPLKFTNNSGIYMLSRNSEAALTEKLTVSEAGILQIQGLDTGTYILKEIKAPDGFVLPIGTGITIKLEDKAPDGELEKNNINVAGSYEVVKNSVEVNKNILEFSVKNKSGNDAGFMLPETGGAGTVLFTIVGIVLMGGAAAIFVMLTRKKHGEQ